MTPPDDLSDLLPILRPPPGGLPRLRAMVAAERRSRARWAASVLVLAAAALALFVGLRHPGHSHRPSLANDPVLAALSADSDANSLTVLDPRRLAAARVPTSSAVVYFRVEGVAAK